MSNFDLTVVTLNVRSLTDSVKRQNLFYLLRTWSADVICLQEVHATPALAAVWATEWGGASSWNHYTAILFKRRFGTPKFDVLERGRVLSSTFEYRGRQLKIANFYLPAVRAECTTFLDAICQTHSLHFSSFDFLVGDWNSYPDPLRDRTSTSTASRLFPSVMGWAHLTPLIVSFFDAAMTGASSPYFTYQCVCTGKSRCSASKPWKLYPGTG